MAEINVRLTQIDGKLPNLALMKLSHYHKSLGHNVHFFKRLHKDLFEPNYDYVYGSSIFKFSEKAQTIFKTQFPDALIAGTGTNNNITVEDIIQEKDYEYYDYDIYPEFNNSIGFSQRGCRLKCKFCVVPNKEGKNYSLHSINEIWRKNNNKNIILLDNDFFGQQNWETTSKEIIDGKFKVNFNQGINVRLINENACNYLQDMKYYDVKFENKRLYTAWDNLKDEKIVFKGLKLLENANIPMNHIMVYMLIGFDKNETWERILYRFEKLVDKGVMPYPMVYDQSNKQLKKFQRWVVRRYYQFVKWEDYKDETIEQKASQRGSLQDNDNATMGFYY